MFATEGLTIMSDQQKGIILSVSELLPIAEHRMCARHIWANLKKKCNDDEIRMFFWSAAKSYTEAHFRFYMEKIKEISMVAYNELERNHPRHWCRAFFSMICKCDSVNNNFSASIAHNNIISPKAQELLDAQKEIANACKVLKNGRHVFEVSHKGCSFTCNLHLGCSCPCRYKDISGIPCGHLIAAGWEDSEGRLKPEYLVSDCWKNERWKNTYASALQPANGMSLWTKTTTVKVLAPLPRIMPGRPRNKDRKKEAFEDSTRPRILTKHGRTVKCTHCQQEGHNKKTCPRKMEPPVLTEKRPRGRPRVRPANTEVGTSRVRRPRKNNVAANQESCDITQPSQDSSEYRRMIGEGYGILTNSLTGELYYHTGTSAIDLRENTISSAALQRQRDLQIREMQQKDKQHQ